MLAEVLQVKTVPVDAHLFDDLGADSMVLARFCARVRKREDLPTVSIKDVYQHPTISGLATALAPPPAAVEPAPVAAPLPPPADARAGTPRPAPVGTAGYLLCGTVQALFFIGYCLGAATVGVAGYAWISDGVGIIDTYLRAVVIGGGSFVGLSILPILVKWVLVGRWRAEEFPVWSLRYVRFWIVKTLVQRNPLVLFATGTPLYPLYLRALGAKGGRDVAVDGAGGRRPDDRGGARRAGAHDVDPHADGGAGRAAGRGRGRRLPRVRAAALRRGGARRVRVRRARRRGDRPG